MLLGLLATLAHQAPAHWLAQALAQAQRVEVTEIQQPFEGDAFAPTLDASWHAVARSPQHVSAQGLPYAFVSYRRAPQQG